jgi:hypothetical protein
MQSDSVLEGLIIHIKGQNVRHRNFDDHHREKGSLLCERRFLFFSCRESDTWQYRAKWATPKSGPSSGIRKMPKRTASMVTVGGVLAQQHSCINTRVVAPGFLSASMLDVFFRGAAYAHH